MCLDQNDWQRKIGGQGFQVIHKQSIISLDYTITSSGAHPVHWFVCRVHQNPTPLLKLALAFFLGDASNSKSLHERGEQRLCRSARIIVEILSGSRGRLGDYDQF
jgi:hypothetical protein